MKATNTKAATLIAALKTALKTVGAVDGKRDDKLKLAATAICEAYPTRESWDAMTKEAAQSLRAAYASGRLAAAEFKLWSTPVKNLDDTTKAARLALHRDINTAWNRIVGHAYPKAKTESAEGGKAEGDKAEEEKTEGAASPDQWAKILSTMLTQAQKAEGLKNVDLVGFQSALRTARSFVTLTSAE
jgi:hypothetical protein